MNLKEIIVKSVLGLAALSLPAGCAKDNKAATQPIEIRGEAGGVIIYPNGEVIYFDDFSHLERKYGKEFIDRKSVV